MAVALLLPFANWLADTPLAHADRNAVRTILWVAPVDETLHILAICTVVSCIGVLNLRLLGAAARQIPLKTLADKLLPLIWGALVVLFLTGGVLVLNRPTRYLRSEMFLSKMVLILIAIVWTLVLNWSVRRDAAFWELSPARRHAAQLTGAAAIVLWVAVITAGRWIAYAG